MAHRREDFPYETWEEPGTSDTASRVDADMPWDDESLVAGLKLHDSRAVQYAVETYAPKLYRYAIYQLGEHAAAEDVASETVARMLEKIEGYEQRGAPFRSWLFSIARNLIRDSYRHKKTSHTISLDAADETSELLSLGSPDNRIDGFADRDELVRLMANLTEEQRQILTLRILQGWQPQEIADLLGRTIDSVKSLQYRALQAMKKEIGRYEQ
jgi:RNA polymerase sigma-70 factor (ECF subfamily)